MKTLGTIVGYVVVLTVLFGILWIFVKVLEAVFWLLVPIFTVTGEAFLLIILGMLFSFLCGAMWANR